MKNKKTTKLKDKSWIDPFVENLNRNVKLDHIRYVDKGIRPMDDDYKKFKKEMTELLGEDGLKKHSDNRESLYPTKKKN